MISGIPLIACHECDLLQRDVPLAEGGTARCRRCGGFLHRHSSDSIERTLAYAVAAVVLFVLANAFPIVAMEAQGNRNETSLYSAVVMLWNQDVTSVAALVAVTTLLMPALTLSIMLYILLPLQVGYVPSGLAPLLRFLESIRPWGMVEVFMLGVLVSLVKLTHFADVIPGIGLWSFAVLIVLLAAAAAAFNSYEVWQRVSAGT